MNIVAPRIVNEILDITRINYLRKSKFCERTGSVV